MSTGGIEEEVTNADEVRTTSFQTRISRREATNSDDPKLRVRFESTLGRNGRTINIRFDYRTSSQFLPNSPVSLMCVDNMLNMVQHNYGVIENFRSRRNEIIGILAGLAREDLNGMEETVREVLFRMSDEEFEDEMATTFEEENADVEVPTDDGPVALTSVKYDGSKSKECYDEKTCCICLVDFVDGVEVNKLDCLHIFHVDCLCKWLKKSKSCPFCRVDVANGNTD